MEVDIARRCVGETSLKEAGRESRYSLLTESFYSTVDTMIRTSCASCI